MSRGSHRDRKRSGDTAIKSRGDLIQVNMPPERVREGIEAQLEGREDRITGLDHRYGPRKSSEGMRGM